MRKLVVYLAFGMLYKMELLRSGYHIEMLPLIFL